METPPQKKFRQGTTRAILTLQQDLRYTWDTLVHFASLPQAL